MRIVIEVDDDADRDQVASAIEAVQSGRFIAIRRPDGLSNEQVGSPPSDGQPSAPVNRDVQLEPPLVL